MDFKQNSALTGLVFFIVGILVGWLIWGSSLGYQKGMMAGSHRMGDGMMMRDDSMGMMMGGMVSGLQGKTGNDFDKAFLDEMIVHHQGAIDMANLAAANAAHPEIKTLASGIITAQTNEIAQMKQWRASWFK